MEINVETWQEKLQFLWYRNSNIDATICFLDKGWFARSGGMSKRFGK